MARILLGVSGGIAAYKALELVRLATAAGHAVRVVQTPTSRRFVGEASFAALSGAPVLVSEFERDPARGAFPGEPRRRTSRSATWSSSQRRRVPDRAGLGEHDRQARRRAGRQPARAAARSRPTCPLLVAPAMNNHMYEHPATQANLQTLRERGVTIVEPGERAAGLQGRAGHRAPGRAGAAAGGVRGGARRTAARAVRRERQRRRAGARGSLERPARARHRRRHARADRQRALSSATAPPGAWASRSPRRRWRAAPR